MGVLGEGEVTGGRAVGRQVSLARLTVEHSQLNTHVQTYMGAPTTHRAYAQQACACYAHASLQRTARMLSCARMLPCTPPWASDVAVRKPNRRCAASCQHVLPTHDIYTVAEVWFSHHLYLEARTCMASDDFAWFLLLALTGRPARRRSRSCQSYFGPPLACVRNLFAL